MPDEKAGVEPLLTQLPTTEVKRILTERFARDVASEARQRIWRPLTVFGLPGIVLVGSLVWQLIDNSVTGKVNALRGEAATTVTNTVNPLIEARFQAIGAQVREQVREQVAQAFDGQRGRTMEAALNAKLGELLAGEEFRASLDRIVTTGLDNAWRRLSPELRGQFLSEFQRDDEFRRALAGDVERAMVDRQSVQRIIGDAMQASVERRSGDDRGHLVALPLLAATSQATANAGVLRLLETGRAPEEREVALQALNAVSFISPGGERMSPGQLLPAALEAWQAHCAELPCPPESDAAKAMVGFLRRGGELRGAERETWMLALRVWHEGLARDSSAPGREASVTLVPRALGQIGSPDAVAVLRGWVTGGEPQLMLTASAALGGLGATAMPAEERQRLFRAIWARVAEGAGLRAAVEEAGWLALGAVSRGEATPATFPMEAGFVGALGSESGSQRSDLAGWAAERTVGTSRGRQALRPPPAACTSPTQAEGAEAAGQLRTDLCALVALLRPGRGRQEWLDLRPVLVQRDPVALLGLLWTVAIQASPERTTMPPAARHAPLADLLLSVQPAPPGFQLAAMLMLRSGTDQAGWSTLEAFGPDLRDARPYFALLRWLGRGNAEEEQGYADRLGRMPPAQREAVVRALLGLPPAEAEPGLPAGGPMPRITDRLRLNAGAMVNTLVFTRRVAPELVLATVERENLLPPLREVLERRGRVLPREAELLQELLAGLTAEGGWPAARQLAARGDARPSAEEGARMELAPGPGGHFGQIRLNGGSLLQLAARSGTAPVTFHDVGTGETQVVEAGEVWYVPRGEAQGPQDWLYRLPDAEPRHLEAVQPQSITLAAAREAAPPVIRPGQVYQVTDLRPENDRGQPQGWARIEGLLAGQRMVVRTLRLGAEVDTVVALHRGQAQLARDDDGGGNWESLLDWTVDRSGPVLLEIVNIGDPGPFSFMVKMR